MAKSKDSRIRVLFSFLFFFVGGEGGLHYYGQLY